MADTGNGPRIWVDADSCPRPVRDILSRASMRTGLSVTFVANRDIPVLSSDNVHVFTMDTSTGTADDVILAECRPGDIAVTRDIPLAARLLEKGCIVLNDRGDRFSCENIRERLSRRDRMKELRQSGLVEEGRRSFGKREVHAFAAALDGTLAALLNR